MLLLLTALFPLFATPMGTYGIIDGGAVATAVAVNGITPGTTAAAGESFVVSFIVVGALGTAAPTGAIKYSVDGGTAQTAALSNGTASVTFAGLSIGTHTVLNSYSGDGNYLATTPTALTLTVSKGTLQLVNLTIGDTVNQNQIYPLGLFLAERTLSILPTGMVTCTVDGSSPQTVSVIVDSASLTFAGLSLGPHTIVCTYGGDANYASATTGLTLNVIGPALPGIYPGGVVSAAGFVVSLSPGAIGSIFGTGLAASSARVSSLPLPTTLGGVQVLVNGAPAPLFSVSPDQINFQAPRATPVGMPLQMVVILNGVSSLPVNVTFAAYAPAVFTYQRTSTSTDPVIVHADNTLVTPTSPAKAGETLVIYATGAGKLNNAPMDSAPAPLSPPATTVDTPVVLLGAPQQQVQATVRFSGLTPGVVGLLQINIQLPATLPPGAGTPPSLPLTIGFPGVVSSPVGLWVQQ